MYSHCFAFLLLTLLGVSNAIAQNRGILPLTGAKYFPEGIWGKTIDITADGAQLLSNRIPVNKEAEVKLVLPAGLTPDKNGRVFPAIELTILSANGEQLAIIPNTLKASETSGIAQKDCKELSTRFQIKPEWVRNEQAGLVRIRFAELKTKNQLRLEFPFVIARPGEAFQLSKTVLRRSADKYAAVTHVVRAGKISSFTDTSIRVNPMMAYASLEIGTLEGTGTAEVLAGKEQFWVFDQHLEEVKITDRLLKQVTGSLEGTTVNYLLKIPFRAKSITGQGYTVRFRWESPDKRKLIDVVLMP